MSNFLGPEKFQPSLESIYKGLGIPLGDNMHQDHIIDIHVQKLHPDAVLPFKKNKWDAGWDLYSTESVVLEYGVPTKIKTGIAMAIPKGYVGLIWDRSGMGSKGNKVFGGVIDATYRGEVIVCLTYLNNETDFSTSYFIEKGDKIAQILFAKSPEASIIEVEDIALLGQTERGEQGFGSSGR